MRKFISIVAISMALIFASSPSAYAASKTGLTDGGTHGFLVCSASLSVSLYSSTAYTSVGENVYPSPTLRTHAEFNMYNYDIGATETVSDTGTTYAYASGSYSGYSGRSTHNVNGNIAWGSWSCVLTG